ncbi:MAG: LCP family protein, partial [Candidatus Limnocylindrales bacterium]
MPNPQDAPPRGRSPFAAAFLSLLFPGLGHLYAGAPMRALGFAAAPILLIALGAGVLLRMNRIELLGLVLSPFILTSVLIVNIVALLYRLIAIVDAYRVARFLNAHAAGANGQADPGRSAGHSLSIAGLLAVLLVMAGSHVVVARYDFLALDALTSGCIFVTDEQDTTCAADASATPGITASPDSSADPTQSPDPSEALSPEPTAVGTPVPQVSIPPWDGKERLNVVLIGADEQGGGHRTDTLITVSIDPLSGQVAMFSLPRDTVDVPIPAGPARSVWGGVYSSKINSFFINNHRRSDLWPGNNKTRGYNGLKAVLSELYGLDVKYFVEVNFDGFKKVVDKVGGITVNV